MNGNFARPLLKILDLDKTLLEIGLIADDPDEILHLFLKLVLDSKCVIVVVTRVRTVKGLQRFSRRMLDLIFVDAAFAVLFRELCRETARAFTEYKQIGKRIATQPV